MTRKSIEAAMAQAVALAKEANPAILPADIAFLVGERLGLTPSQLRLHGRELLLPAQMQQLNADVAALINGQSPQYILGYAWFLGEQIKVNEHVLIPRFETEELVAWVAADLKLRQVTKHVDVLDLGTGSGAILVGLSTLLNEAVVKHALKLRLSASDISGDALAVARKNFKQHNLAVQTIAADVLQGLGKFDVIVSNPPYIMDEEAAVMDASVLLNEPHLALFAGVDGLDFYRRFTAQVDAHLNENGCFYLEFGYRQKQLLADLLTAELPNYTFEFRQDMEGHDRMVRGIKHETKG